MIHEEMNPCPKCGATHLVTIVFFSDNIEIGRAISCKKCRCTGPVMRSQILAEDRWNEKPRGGTQCTATE